MSIYFFLILGSCVFGIYFYKNGYKKHTLLYTLLLIPFIYFSLNMIDQAMTVDEPGYITAFMHMDEMERGSILWKKGTYQYRVAEIFSGTICLLISKLFSVSDDRLIIIYKYTHWMLYIGVILRISQIWNKIFNYDVDSTKYRMSNAAVLLILIGAPISCLILKVCNYDAGCVLFGIAGLSFIILADRLSNPRIAFVGTLVAVLSCLQKWSGLPYWCVCASTVGALTYKSTKNVKKAILADLKVIICSFAICWLSLIYIRLIQGYGIVDINIGAGLFPLFFMAKAFFALSGSVDFTDINLYDSEAWKYILFIVVSVVIFSFVLEAGRKIYDKCYTSRKDRIVCTLLAFAIVLGGIVASFVIIRSQYPFTTIPEDVYVPKAIVNGTTFFFNTRTRWGYILANMFYAVSVELTNWPTAYLLIFFAACAAIIKSKKVFIEYYLFLTEVFVMIMPIAYVLAGNPAIPRYFGVSILLIPIFSVYIVGHYTDEDGSLKKIMMKRAISILLYILVLVEMILYIPNYVSFAPLWLYRSEQFRTTVRQGEWATGEAMMWGEDLAIAGNKVMELIGPQDDYSQYTLYRNYDGLWLKNPGFNIKDMRNNIEELSWTDKDYYIFTKFMTYRSEPPELLVSVVPDAVISYKGEIAAWIYRGDRIKDYYP